MLYVLYSKKRNRHNERELEESILFSSIHSALTASQDIIQDYGNPLTFLVPLKFFRLENADSEECHSKIDIFEGHADPLIEVRLAIEALDDVQLKVYGFHVNSQDIRPDAIITFIKSICKNEDLELFALGEKEFRYQTSEENNNNAMRRAWLASIRRNMNP